MRSRRKRRKDTGVSLLNVLVVAAAGAGIVQVMLTGQERAIDYLAHASQSRQAAALADAGVKSVAVALRRDLAVAPETDHPAEAWATSSQKAINLDDGTFEVTTEDLRGRFDLNALGASNLAENRVFAALLRSLDLPQSLAMEVRRIVARHGPLVQPGDLLGFGVNKADLVKLLPHVAALPVRHPINLNTASEALLAALFSNPPAARSLSARRAGKGYLDRSDLAALSLAVPPHAGFTSDAFRVTSDAAFGAARHVAKRLVLRDHESGSVTVLRIP